MSLGGACCHIQNLMLPLIDVSKEKSRMVMIQKKFHTHTNICNIRKIALGIRIKTILPTQILCILTTKQR